MAQQAAAEQQQQQQELARTAPAAGAVENAPAPSAGMASDLEAVKEEGNAHFKAQRYEAAEAAYRECLSRDPGFVAVHLNMIALLNATGRYLEADAAATRALELLASGTTATEPAAAASQRSKAYHRRSMARKELGRLEEALEDLRAAKALMGQSLQLDAELEALGKLVAEARDGGSATQAAASAPAAPAPAGPPSPSEDAAAQTSRAAEPARPPQAEAPASAATAKVGAGSGATQRKSIAVEVEDDESDEEEAPAPASAAPQAQPAPPASSAASVPAAPASSVSVSSSSVGAHAAAPAPPAASTSVGASSATPPAQGPAKQPAAKPAAAAAVAAAKPAAAAAGGVSADAGDTAEADRLREEGNRLYGVGNYVRALDFYNRSIGACAHNPAAYCNRAFVQLHLKRPADALLDAEAAIEQAGGKYPKAQLRRALALRDLGRHDDGMAALKQLLEVSPGDAALLEEMRNMQRLAAAARGGGGAAVAAAAPPKPVQAPPVRHKIMVEQEESDDEELLRGDGSSGAAAAAAASKAGPAKASITVVAGTANGTAQASSKPASEKQQSAPSASTANGAACVAGNGASAASPSGAAPAPTAASGRNLHAVASAKAAAALASKVPKVPKPPKNAHELEQALKSLAGYPSVLHEFIRTVDPSSYGGVIKANLSVNMIQGIVDTARDALRVGQEEGEGGEQQQPTKADVDFALQALESLPTVPRFDTTFTMAPKAVKEQVRAVVGALGSAGRDVAHLRKSYKL
ncbi:hypothetical protein GPECTOR_96g728 [Gonium pectorale]|uniref:RNA-polymerase II-associated protein 3-like C-terminal domain-containing protein n=1 Tax=Gonium pectorale TaxID=33097 RepID=A0A150G088_GONPE|nr:hypothetical protein GPECTOR_96g728 [Gonium pectorale]|eukprot:KXZ43262.1 hypothetical protein GPECTOR_96g728 [Gonium pectorale]